MKNDSIEFVEWVAKNHYRLINIQKGICIWQNENGQKNTKELYKLFLN